MFTIYMKTLTLFLSEEIQLSFCAATENSTTKLNCVNIYCNGLDFCSKEWPLIVTFRCFQNINKCQSPYLSALDFCNFPVWNIKFDELDCFPRLNWIFLPALVCEIQVWNRLKIQFIKLDISNWRMSKIKFR